MDIFSLSASLTLDSSGLESGLARAKSSFSGLESTASGAASSIQSSFSSLSSALSGIGSNLCDGLMNGLSSAVSRVRSWTNELVSTVKTELGIHSPSRVFAEIGQNMAAGLAQGWGDPIGDTVRAVRDFHPASVDFASSAIGKSSSAQINTMLSGLEERGGSYNINLVVDGRTLANVVFDPLHAVSKQKGVVLGA